MTTLIQVLEITCDREKVHDFFIPYHMIIKFEINLKYFLHQPSIGIEMMRLFVIANTILVFVTVAWPNIKESLYIIRDYFLENN